MNLPSNVTPVERDIRMFRHKGLSGEWRVIRRTRPFRRATILHPSLLRKGIRPTEVSLGMEVSLGTEVSPGMEVSLVICQDTSRVMGDLRGDIKKTLEANMRDVITIHTIITAATKQPTNRYVILPMYA